MTVETEKIAEAQRVHLKDAARKAYAAKRNEPLADERIIEYLPMVNSIARQISRYINPPLSFEDLVSAGTIGLVKAARDFDPCREAEFKTYAYIRIRGAMIDELRSWSFVPSNINRQVQDMQRVFGRLTAQDGVMPTDAEFAEALGITVERLYRSLESARGRHFLSIHGLTDESPALGQSLAASDTPEPSESIERAELVEKLTEGIQRLPERQRRIIVLYYQQALTMKQISRVMKITESRVSQLHASALFKLSVRLRQCDESGE